MDDIFILVNFSLSQKSNEALPNMVNTFLSEADQLARKDFKKFAQDKLATFISKSNSLEVSPIIFLKEMAQASYLALNVPSEYGGKNKSFLQLILLAEEISHYDVGIAIYFSYHIAFMELLKKYGSEKQKSFYLPKLAKGEILGTIAYLEQSQNTKVNDDAHQLVLNGNKHLIVSAWSEDNNLNGIANIIAVFAGNNLFLLDSLEVPNISIKPQKLPMGLKSLNFVSIDFENYKIEREQLLAEDSITSQAMSYARDVIKTMLAACALGMADSSLEQMISGVQSTEKTSKPLSQSQAILWKLANTSTDTSAARLLTYRAAWSKEDEPTMFSQYATMAKSYTTQIARVHTGEALQVLLPLLQMQYTNLTDFYADSKMLEVFDSTNEEEKVLLSTLLGI
jgi:alkylation response protein AidB-like acyl-CoA dehydrogenase